MLDWLRRNILEQEVKGRYTTHGTIKTSFKLFLISFITLCIGLITFIFYLNINIAEFEYLDSVTGKIFLYKGKNYMYIEIDFNQANLKYIRSINYKQLKGETTDLNLDDTAPFDKRDNKPFYPAGELPASYFQDRIDVEGLDIEQENIIFEEDLKRIGITGYKAGEIEIPEYWSEDTNKGSIPLNTENVEKGLPILNERFINWIQLTLFYPTKKLWGIVNVPETKNYNVTIESKSDYDKKLIFTDNSWFGFKNLYLPITFFFISLICLLLGIAIYR